MQLYIVAGELSGDKHGSLMLKELKKLIPELQIQGLGGPLMHEVSPAIENWVEDAAVVGFVEVIRNYGFFRRHFLELLKSIKAQKPAAVIFLDYPGFNLRLAKVLKKECPETKLIYFISPQVWAWNKGRLPQMAATLDLMLCIFPFEKEVFEKSGLKTEFVGHPLVDDIQEHTKEGLRDPQLIGLFAGSRSREIERIFPTMLECVKTLSLKHPDWRFEAAPSSQKWAQRMQELACQAGLDENTLLIKLNNYHSLMNRAGAALVTSGTATMEAALHGLPYALVYKVAPLTYWMAKKLITIPHIGMVNILMQKEVVKELIQGGFSAQSGAEELERLLLCPEERAQVLLEMQEAVAKLGPGGAAQRAAQEIAQILLPEASH